MILSSLFTRPNNRMAYIGTVNGELIKFQGKKRFKVIHVYSKLIHVLQYTCIAIIYYR